MMMAHDSSPGPSGLDVQTIETVRVALEQYISTSAHSQTLSVSSDSVSSAHSPRLTPASPHGEQLRLALRAMAEEAREKSVLPEALLLVLKQVWHSLPIVSSKRDHDDQVMLLQRVVTMCIKEYYAD